MKRLSTFLINIRNLPTMIAFRVVRRAIRRDPGYAIGWQSNMAMAIYDESRSQNARLPYTENVIRRTERGDFDGILSVPRAEAVEGMREQANGQRPLDGAFCNRAATRFMDLCFGRN